MNLAAGFIGVAGTGKSTEALRRAYVAAAAGGYILAHDPGWRLPERWPDGSPTGVIHHDGIADARDALASSPAGVHAVDTADGDDVLELALVVGEASLDRARADQGDQGGELYALPVILMFDEGVAAGGLDPYRLGPGIREALARRRHRHMGIIYTCQSPHQVHYQLLTQGSELYAFRNHDGRALRRLEEVGFTKAETRAIASLPDYHFVMRKL
jgi:hypothetical protein